MTTDQLATLSPRRRAVLELRVAGKTTRETAAALGITPNYVARIEYVVRQRMEGPIPRKYQWRARCRRGHEKTPGERCWACAEAREKRMRRAETARPVVVAETLTPAERVKQDIATGKRCGKCWLLTPCDHTP